MEVRVPRRVAAGDRVVVREGVRHGSDREEASARAILGSERPPLSGAGVEPGDLSFLSAKSGSTRNRSRAEITSGCKTLGIPAAWCTLLCA